MSHGNNNEILNVSYIALDSTTLANSLFNSSTFDNSMLDNSPFNNSWLDNGLSDDRTFGGSWLGNVTFDDSWYDNHTALDNGTFDNSSVISPSAITVCGYVTRNLNRTASAHLVSALVLVEKYFGLPLLIFGIVTNILTLLTLQSPKLKESPYVYLTALTVADLLALLLIFINQLGPVNYFWSLYTVHVYYPLSNIAATFGAWVMIAMTMERCLFVQFPLWAPVRCTVSRARIKTVVMFLVSCAINSPRFFWYTVVLCSVEENTTEVVPNIQQNLSIDDKVVITVAWFYTTFFNFVPLLVLFILNSFLIYKVQTQQRRRAKLGIHRNTETVWTREQTRLTVTFIAIVFLFLVLVVPSSFSDPTIMLPIFGLDDLDHATIAFQHVTNMLVWVNLSINFLLYTFINTKFLQAFKTMVSRWRRVARLCVTVLCRRLQRKRMRRHLQKQSSFAISGQQETFSFNIASV
ncbi:unnamed protein product [Lymnaea stagnalis]|uniref:G-protein coupled receptors family 1 profile domain-containing protein n=1 Tax=Lymnaea stagnalis TaxID=6523 RepID=A0AAV2I2D1_LYMST